MEALVTTELQVKVRSSFDACVRSLQRLARAAPADTRCHCLNVLRALYRCSQLDEAVGPLVGDGLLVALRAFDSGSWLERNSATLLFSALVVRVFGVQRSRAERLCVRNRMTGRIFFLRYPQLYDFMLDKLKEASEDTEQLVHPALFPTLLLLARLYPSSLEGTVSNLKLATFVPLVGRSGAGAVLLARRLAARAAPALVAPDLFVSHVEGVLNLLCDQHIKRNFCHGLLLQVLKLLDGWPESVAIGDEEALRLSILLRKTSWILQQALAGVPCYLLADEYIKVLNVVFWRFQNLLDENYVKEIQGCINDLLFSGHKGQVNPGRELCLANAAYLNVIILHRYNKRNEICTFLYKSLTHETYEVVLAVMNYLLILYEQLDIENDFQEHINEISNRDILKLLREHPNYVQTLCEVLKTCKYLECTQKCLQLLTLEPNTQNEIIKAKEGVSDISDDVVMEKLFGYIENEHGNLTHIYLASLCDFLTRNIKGSLMSDYKVLEALRVVFACSLSDNSDETRAVVVGFMEENLKSLLELDLDTLGEGDRFEFRVTVWAAMVVLLEDEEEELRGRASLAVGGRPLLPARAAELLLETVERDQLALPMLALLALLDFRAEVCMNDELNDECRVFDSNERYNTNLEETVWTRACAETIKRIRTDDINGHVYRAITADNRWRTFDKLCGRNYTAYKTLVESGDISKTDANPKVDIFYNTLHS